MHTMPRAISRNDEYDDVFEKSNIIGGRKNSLVPKSNLQRFEGFNRKDSFLSPKPQRSQNIQVIPKNFGQKRSESVKRGEKPELKALA